MTARSVAYFTHIFFAFLCAFAPSRSPPTQISTRPPALRIVKEREAAQKRQRRAVLRRTSSVFGGNRQEGQGAKKPRKTKDSGVGSRGDCDGNMSGWKRTRRREEKRRGFERFSVRRASCPQLYYKTKCGRGRPRSLTLGRSLHCIHSAVSAGGGPASSISPAFAEPSKSIRK